MTVFRSEKTTGVVEAPVPFQERRPNLKGAPCAAPACDRLSVVRAGDARACNKHYQRWLATGNWSAPDKPVRAHCTVDGCLLPPKTKHGDHCTAHSARIQRNSGLGLTPIATHCDECRAPLSSNQSRFCSSACGRRNWLRPIERRLRAYDQAHRLRAKKMGCEFEERIDLLAIVESHDWHCYLCGGPIDPKLRRAESRQCLSIDHVIALAMGGAHSAANCKPAHFQCNWLKAAQREIPAIGKVRRIVARLEGTRRPRKAIPSGPFPQGKRTIPSRPFGKREKP